MTNTEETYARHIKMFESWLNAQSSPTVMLAAIKRHVGITSPRHIVDARPAGLTIPLSPDEARHAFRALKDLDLTYWIILRLVYELGVMPAFLLGNPKVGHGLADDDILSSNGHIALMISRRGSSGKSMHVLRGAIEDEFKYWLRRGRGARSTGRPPMNTWSIFGVTKSSLWKAQRKVIESLQASRVIRPEIKAGASTIFRKSPSLRVSDDARVRDMWIAS